MESVPSAVPPPVGGTEDGPGMAPGDRPVWRRAWLVVGVVLLTLFAAFVLWNGSGTFYYVVMAWFLALAMEPAVGRLSRRMPRGAATGLVLVAVLVGLGVFLALFGGLFVSQLTSLVQAVPGIVEDALKRVNEVSGSEITLEGALDSLGLSTATIAGYADDVAFGIFGILASVLSGAFGIFVLLFFTFYISAAMPRLRAWIAKRLRPSAQVPFLAAWDLTRIKVGGYMAARIVLASINAVTSGIAFAIIGLPYWLPLALWTGIVAQFVPNIGTYISIALPVVVGLTSPQPLDGVWVLAWAVAYQQVENLTIEPRISARAVDLHPAVSFGAALLGAQLFGLSGALLGVPVAATAMAMLEIYKRRYELTEATEARVAALVAPRADKDTDETEAALPRRTDDEAATTAQAPPGG